MYADQGFEGDKVACSAEKVACCVYVVSIYVYLVSMLLVCQTPFNMSKLGFLINLHQKPNVHVYL